jgi:hypothetical protein
MPDFSSEKSRKTIAFHQEKFDTKDIENYRIKLQNILDFGLK